MQIVRMYSGSDGESHFEDLTTDQLAELVTKGGDGPIRLLRGSALDVTEFHNVPRRQYVVIMAGHTEVETSDGSKRCLFPGDVLVAEDLTGRGHATRGGGELPMALTIPLNKEQ